MRYIFRIRKGFLFAALVIPWLLLTYAWFAHDLLPGKNPVLPAGMRVFVQVIENVNGIDRREGQVFRALVSNAVEVEGTVVIPQGSAAHIRVTRKSGQADGSIAVYSVQLVDVELRGELHAVSTDTRDIPVDVATGSPYPGPATGLILSENSLLQFTLVAPFSANA